LIRQKFNPFGGAERFIGTISRAISQIPGATLTIMASQWPESDGVSSTNDLIGTPSATKFVRLPTSASTRSAKYRSIEFTNAVLAEIGRRKGEYDIVQSHERIPGIPLYRAGDGVHATWLKLRRRYSGPLESIMIALNPLHRHLVRSEQEMFQQVGLKGVICNSKMVRDDIHARFGIPIERLKLSYNGVDQTIYRPALAEQRESIRDNFHIPRSSPLLLYAGSGFARKGVDDLLHAFSSLEKNSYLAIAGTDKRMTDYKKRAIDLGIASRVVFLGGVVNLAPWYGAADLFVLPTWYDPMPNAVLEALSSGLPVITTRTCGGAELILDGKSGLVVAASDRIALANAVRQVIHRDGISLMDRRQIASTVSHLSINRIAADMIDYYKSIVRS
jgi:UDP-glucose:(heptosyl)LPS alpha-1,3-glucosyltransferase